MQKAIDHNTYSKVVVMLSQLLKAKINYIGIVLVITSLYSSQTTFAQTTTDSIYHKESNTTVVVDTNNYKEIHSPKRAGWMSTALPGLGQAYNKKYWKIPAIYATFGVITYFLIDNQKNYVKYRDSYIARIDDDDQTVDEFPNLSTDAIRLYKNHYWKNRDLSILLLAAVYTLNILDAVVDAHFYTYDISDDLSLKFTPVVNPNLQIGAKQSMYTGLSVSLSF